MKLLAVEKYHKLLDPLILVTINKLFARSVVEQHIKGRVYVDNTEHPRTFYVVHPYGMSLLFGDCGNSEFNNAFKDYALNVLRVREKHEWMQIFPGNWEAVLNDLFKDCLIKSADNTENIDQGIVELNTRINFKLNYEKYAAFRKTLNEPVFKIVRTDKKIFNEMKGTVIPAYFWENADDFVKNGVGFSLLYEGKLASTAYSAFIIDDKLELGIETVEAFRGKGFAQFTCSALIDYCLENNLEPIWACKLENTGSYLLAQKIGFESVLQIPFYRLSN